MAKFKVWDKVLVVNASKLLGLSKYIGKEATITEDDGSGWEQYRIDLDGGGYPWNDTELQLIATKPVREFIVIHYDGDEVVADRTPHIDGSQFDDRAKLAFDRLMGREEPKPEPKPAHRFKVGDRVRTCFGNGTVIFVDPNAHDECNVPYLVKGDNWGGEEAWIGCVTDKSITDGRGCKWFEVDELSLSPAPEPPKYIPQIGDRVVTEFGIGSVIRISGSGEAGVWHDAWDEGHNFHGLFDGLSGDRGWWVTYSDVKPLTGASDVR